GDRSWKPGAQPEACRSSGGAARPGRRRTRPADGARLRRVLAGRGRGRRRRREPAGRRERPRYGRLPHGQRGGGSSMITMAVILAMASGTALLASGYLFGAKRGRAARAALVADNAQQIEEIAQRDRTIA